MTMQLLATEPVSRLAEASMVYFLLIAMGCVTTYIVKPAFSRCPTFSTPVSVLWFSVGLLTSFAVLNSKSTSLFAVSFEQYVININSGVVYLILLPPLLYEGAISTDGMKFRLLLWVSIYLATVGIAVTASLLAVGEKFMSYHLNWSEALLFGSILSSTDPVAVISVLKGMNCPTKLTAVFEGESLLNDGTSVILYQLLLMWAKDNSTSYRDFLPKIMYHLIGSPILGVIAAVLASVSCRMFSGLAPIKSIWLIVCNSAAFWIGDKVLGVSGPLVSVLFGLTIKFWGFRSLDHRDLKMHHNLLQSFAVLSEMLIFELSGAIAALLIFKQTDGSILTILKDATLSFLSLLFVRGFLLFVSQPIMSRLSPFSFSWKENVLLWLGGLRGAIVLALTLMIQEEELFSESFRNTAPLIIAATVGLNLVVQGQLFGVVYLWLNPYPISAWEATHADNQFQALDESFEMALKVYYSKGGLPLNAERNPKNATTAIDLLINDLVSPIKSMQILDTVSSQMNMKTREDLEFSHCLTKVLNGAALRQWLPILSDSLALRDITMKEFWQMALDVLPRFEDFIITKKGIKVKKSAKPRLSSRCDELAQLLLVTIENPRPWSCKTVGSGPTPAGHTSPTHKDNEILPPYLISPHPIMTPIAGTLDSIVEDSCAESNVLSRNITLNLIRLVSEDYTIKYNEGLIMQSAYWKLYDAAETMVCQYESQKTSAAGQCLGIDIQWKRLSQKLSLNGGYKLVLPILARYRKNPNALLRVYLFRLCLSDLEAVLTYVDTMERSIFSSGGELITLIDDNAVTGAYSETIFEAAAYIRKLNNQFGEIYHVCSFVYIIKLFVQEKLSFVNEKRKHGILLENIYRPMVEHLEDLADRLRSYKDYHRPPRQL